MKKNIEISIEDAKFLADYKKSHGVLPTKFIDIAIKEKIIKTKAELFLPSEVYYDEQTNTLTKY